MQHWLKIWLMTLAFLASFSVSAQAADNPFLIPELTVTLHQADPVKGREQAIEKATRLGFAQLLRRLTPQSTWPRHADIMAQTKLNQMLEKFTILSEQQTPEYRLKVELLFNRDRVRQLLTQLEIPFSEVGAGPVLLFPLLELSTGSMLWEESNPWRVKLAEEAKKSGLVRFILPIGDPQEMLMLTPEMAAFGAGDMIMEIAKNYNAQVAVVPRLKMTVNAAGQKEAVVDVNWYGKEHIEPQVFHFPVPAGGDIEDTLTQVASQTILGMEDLWRKLYLLEFDRPGSMLVRYAVEDLPALDAVQQKLSHVPIVREVYLRAVSWRRAVFQVDFYGSPERVAELATDQGVHLIRWNDNWVVDAGDRNAQVYGPLVVPPVPVDTAVSPTDAE